MKKCILIFSLLISNYVFNYVFAQSFSEWNLVQVFGNGSVKAKQATYDMYQRYIYVIGDFKNTLVIGKDTLISKGGTDIFIAKFDTLLNPQWAFGFGSTEDDHAAGINTTGPGLLFVAFNFQGTCTVKSYTLSSAGSFDIGLMRLKANGDILAIKRHGGTDEDWINAISKNSLFQGTGYFKGTTQLGSTTLNSAGGKDIFVFTANAALDITIARRHGGTGDDEGLCINSIYFFGGYFTQTASIDTFTLVSAGGRDGFIYQDFYGKRVFHFKGTGDDACTDINGVYFTGHFEQNMQVVSPITNFNLVAKGKKDVFVGKITDLSPIYIQQAIAVGSKEDDSLAKLHSLGNYGDYLYLSFIAKDTVHTPDFLCDVNYPNAVLLNLFVEDGGINFVRHRKIFSGSRSEIVSIIPTAKHILYVAGNFENNVWLNSPYIQPNSNAFLVKATNIKSIAQELTYLDANNYKAPIWGDGMLFWDRVDRTLLEIPKDSLPPKTAVFTANLMVGGLTDASKVKCAGWNLYYKPYEQGPITDPNFYDYQKPNALRVWKFNRAEIEYHKQNYNQPGYVIPDNIKSYPGNGNPSFGQAAQLLPYFDKNNNGKYEPEQGEYPIIKGDQAIWSIYCDDMRNMDTSAMKIEVHQLAYVYNCPTDSILQNTLFMERTIYNRSNQTYYQVLVGDFCDPDIGMASDDADGCDSTLHLGYAYNFDNFDETSAGYWNYPPAVGIVILDRDMYAYKSHYKDFSMCTTLPMTYQGVYNVLQGKYTTGAPTYNNGSNGCLNTTGSYITRYQFSGDPETNTGWLFYDAFPSGRDVKFYISTGFYPVLEPNQSIQYNSAYIFARTHQLGKNRNSVTILKNYAANIRYRYQNNLLQPCTQYSVITDEVKPIVYEVYPNPIQDILNVEIHSPSLEQGVQITIMDMLGKPQLTYFTTQTYSTLSMGNLSKGLYIIQIQDKKQVVYTKVIKQ
ncbi:MAG: T9SS type A sorting domain-containing protein [Bacteroidia bacterium]|nr:T9SS type A sorting domain-containing protein [Bacteroidia bacterium]